MSLDASIFRTQFLRFTERILHRSDAPFVSFHVGLPEEWEGYKIPLRAVARDRLKVSEWRPSEVGSGRIIKRAISAIEINGERDLPRNNLVAWQPRYGPKAQPHRELLSACARRSSLHRLEGWFFDFFHGTGSESDAFEDFLDLAGRRYDLVAYIFFLKNCSKFMPIAPRTFDTAFSKLGIDLKTSQHCSWENYSRYNSALIKIRDKLRAVASISDARLIDAHSFCWMLVRLELNVRKTANRSIPLPIPLAGLRTYSQVEPGKVMSTGEALTADYFIDRHMQQQRLGALAEIVALAAEQKRLKQAGRPDLATKVELVSDRPFLGYDIRSFELDGLQRHIEVKAASRHGPRLTFFLTKTELNQSRTLQNYFFYLVLEVTSQRPTVFSVHSKDVPANAFVPSQYVVNLARSPD